MNRFKLLIASLALCSINAAAYTDADVEKALDFLYANMPLPDSTDRSRNFYIDYVVKPALKAKEEMPWGKLVSDNHFNHFVLPLRVNNEALDKHRPAFYEELKPRVEKLSMRDAVLEINHWCHEKVTYQPSDGRTHSPLQSVSSAIGRCGEESTFTVAALRTMGIPARQVYTPRWAHTDDNHAWVEAWADGQWYFLGACEPEPVLNLGWFNAPAARGMLMHARVFGNYSGEEETLDRSQQSVTLINCTNGYAPVDTVNVTVTDLNGAPVPNATVDFRLYNYAEFYPIATKQTDSSGSASLVCGLGDLLAWAYTPDGRFGFSKVSAGNKASVSIILDKNASSTVDMEIDIVPPPARAANVVVTPEMRAACDLRLAREDSIRNAYTATFSTATDILKASRGNHKVIADFIKTGGDRALRLLATLTEKDLTDVTAEVLADHIQAQGDDSELFYRYVMSPRIHYEELTPYRSALKDCLAPYSETMRNDPQKWVEWVKDNIDTGRSWYPAQATMSSEAVWKHRVTSPESRDIFFVASARVMGIPSRIDPVTGKVQYHHNGSWVDVNFESPKASVAKKGSLQLLYNSEVSRLNDPKYYAHFSLSKIENGVPQLLNYPDFAPWSELFREPATLDAGQYLLVSGQRLADGSVLSRMKILEVCPGELIVDSLTLRHDDSAIEVIGSFNSENRYRQLADDSTPRSLLSTTGRGYYILGLIKPGNEPTNHALRDIALLSDEFNALGRKIMLIFDNADEAARMDFSLLPTLPDVAVVGTDIESAMAKELGAEKPLTAGDYPVFIIADTFNRVVFRTDGYTIGLGQKLVDILQRLE